MKLNLRQGFVAIGMDDLLDETSTLAKTKKRKADTWSYSTKQQWLLHTEQPKAIECSASECLHKKRKVDVLHFNVNIYDCPGVSAA